MKTREKRVAPLWWLGARAHVFDSFEIEILIVTSFKLNHKKSVKNELLFYGDLMPGHMFLDCLKSR